MVMTERYARALVAVHARKLREIIQDVIKTTRDKIMQHKLAELCADCAWCEREYGEKI